MLDDWVITNWNIAFFLSTFRKGSVFVGELCCTRLFINNVFTHQDSGLCCDIGSV